MGDELVHTSILVVEDHVDTRNATQRVLDKCGYDVRTAASAAKARESALKTPPDLLLSDIQLGDGDGCELLAELRSHFPKLVGIAATADVYPADRTRCADAGFTAFLSKPYSLQALIAAIHIALPTPTSTPHHSAR